jgi:hypothetical protein
MMGGFGLVLYPRCAMTLTAPLVFRIAAWRGAQG